MDLCGFKRINDSWGFEAGDDLLVQVAERLNRVARDNDVVARIGGDEFAVMLQSQRSYTAPQVAERRQGRPDLAVYAFKGQSLRLRVSIGVATDEGTKRLYRADAPRRPGDARG